MTVKIQEDVIENNENILYRNPDLKDTKAIYNLVEESKILDVNSSYSYSLISLHFSKTSIVATHNDEIIGFASAYIPQLQSENLFIWQIAVNNNYRGQGIAKKMLLEIVKISQELGIKSLHLTISPSNKASQNLFKSLAKEIDAKIESSPLIGGNLLGDNHEAEDLYIISPISNINSKLI
jgi:L-2,4-diaminobutyric acid acetyltransferase